ncbi:hypothetical protein LJB95_02070 [Paludibacteraceae bacterium OttesenSCG-928-F17]|nr:hypothetical protein [Paludibacteraceae bacterium OttesenSCG-928-F17]
MTKSVLFYISLLLFILFPLQTRGYSDVDCSELWNNKADLFRYNLSNYSAPAGYGTASGCYRDPDYEKSLDTYYKENPSDRFFGENNSDGFYMSQSFLYGNLAVQEGLGIIPPGPPIQGAPIENDLRVFLILLFFYCLCLRRKNIVN